MYQLNHLSLNDAEWVEILERCDPNNYGKVDYYQFLHEIISKKKKVYKEQIDVAFERYDVEKTNKVEIIDYVRVLPTSRLKAIALNKEAPTRLSGVNSNSKNEETISPLDLSVEQ